MLTLLQTLVQEQVLCCLHSDLVDQTHHLLTRLEDQSKYNDSDAIVTAKSMKSSESK